jgi:hypothetical protein
MHWLRVHGINMNPIPLVSPLGNSVTFSLRFLSLYLSLSLSLSLSHPHTNPQQKHLFPTAVMTCLLKKRYNRKKSLILTTQHFYFFQMSELFLNIVPRVRLLCFVVVFEASASALFFDARNESGAETGAAAAIHRSIQ